MDSATVMARTMDAILDTMRRPREPVLVWTPSTIPYSRELDDGSNARWEFDYRHAIDEDDCVKVEVTALRLVTDGSDEHPVKLNSVSPRFLMMAEAEIEGDLESER